MTTPQNPGQYPNPGQPGQPGYPPQAPPAPPKKSRKGLIIGIVVAILAVCGIAAIASGGSSDDSSPTTAAGAPADANKADAPKEEEKKKDDTAGMNQPVRDGKFEFVVTNVETGLSNVGDNEFLNQKAQGQFVVVSLTVKNIGDKAQSFSPSSQKLVDQEGRQSESDTSAQIALGGSDVPVWDNINPGNKVSVKLVFDIPKDATPVELILHDSMFSNGAKVSLKK